VLTPRGAPHGCRPPRAGELASVRAMGMARTRHYIAPPAASCSRHSSSAQVGASGSRSGQVLLVMP